MLAHWSRVTESVSVLKLLTVPIVRHIQRHLTALPHHPGLVLSEEPVQLLLHVLPADAAQSSAHSWRTMALSPSSLRQETNSAVA